MDKAIEREAECMNKMDHENIVKSFGIELDDSGKKYITMEYCEQGNLQQMINTNPNGLNSNHFFKLFDSLVSAMTHMYKMNIVHRDLKPDNVVIALNSNAEYNFKIADFGAARILKHEEHFNSLQGTFEYMHPDKMAKYYFPTLGITPPSELFGFSHEIWSLGVLLYEAAAGHLPFNPTNARKNVKIMYEMTTGKGCNDISAEEHGKKVIWHQQLPKNCVIEEKEPVARFIAGLLHVCYCTLSKYLVFIFFTPHFYQFHISFSG